MSTSPENKNTKSTSLENGITNEQLTRIENMIGTPGGPLLTKQVLLSENIQELLNPQLQLPESHDNWVDNIPDDAQVQYGPIDMTGRQFKDVVEFYTLLQESGIRLYCMDPRIVDFENRQNSCAHEQCGAASVASGNAFTINGKQVFEGGTGGKDIENAIQQSLGQSPEEKLSIHNKTTDGHHDSGIAVTISDKPVTYTFSNNAKQEALEQNLGTPYHIAFPKNYLEKFRQILGDENRFFAFLGALVDINIGIAKNIAETHNHTDLSQTGFYIAIVANDNDNDDKISTFIIDRIKQIFASMEQNGEKVGVSTCRIHI